MTRFRIPSFSDYLREGLSRENWSRYSDSIGVKSETGEEGQEPAEEPPITSDQKMHKKEFAAVAAVATDLLEEDASKLIFTSPYVNDPKDLKLFTKSMTSKAEKIDIGKKSVLTFNDQHGKPSYAVNFELYELKGKKFLIINVKDLQEYSFAVIKIDDYEFFDKETEESDLYSVIYKDQDKRDEEQEKLDGVIKTKERMF